MSSIYVAKKRGCFPLQNKLQCSRVGVKRFLPNTEGVDALNPGFNHNCRTEQSAVSYENHGAVLQS